MTDQFPRPLSEIDIEAEITIHSTQTLDDIVLLCHELSAANGFWNQERNPGEMIALIHSELSEMLEAVRSGSTTPSEKISDFLLEEEEAADVFIRLADYCAGRNLRLAQAIQAKLAFNQTRPYRHGRKF